MKSNVTIKSGENLLQHSYNDKNRKSATTLYAKSWQQMNHI